MRAAVPLLAAFVVLAPGPAYAGLPVGTGGLGLELAKPISGWITIEDHGAGPVVVTGGDLLTGYTCLRYTAAWSVSVECTQDQGGSVHHMCRRIDVVAATSHTGGAVAGEVSCSDGTVEERAATFRSIHGLTQYGGWSFPVMEATSVACRARDTGSIPPTPIYTVRCDYS